MVDIRGPRWIVVLFGIRVNLGKVVRNNDYVGRTSQTVQSGKRCQLYGHIFRAQDEAHTVTHPPPGPGGTARPMFMPLCVTGSPFPPILHSSPLKIGDEGRSSYLAQFQYGWYPL